VLVGRRDELRQNGGLLAAVKRGRSGALVLVGEPGIALSASLIGEFVAVVLLCELASLDETHRVRK
jgi:hypothetical protein